jgi:hypothetical protein
MTVIVTWPSSNIVRADLHNDVNVTPSWTLKAVAVTSPVGLHSFPPWTELWWNLLPCVRGVQLKQQPGWYHPPWVTLPSIQTCTVRSKNQVIFRLSGKSPRQESVRACSGLYAGVWIYWMAHGNLNSRYPCLGLSQGVGGGGGARCVTLKMRLRFLCLRPPAILINDSFHIRI